LRSKRCWPSRTRCSGSTPSGRCSSRRRRCCARLPRCRPPTCATPRTARTDGPGQPAGSPARGWSAATRAVPRGGYSAWRTSSRAPPTAEGDGLPMHGDADGNAHWDADGGALDTEAAAERAERFLALHRPGEPLLIPNPWDAGSARVLASLGFTALATTSGGFAATLGRRDGAVSRDEALANAADIVAATGLPVTADLENGYADEIAGVAQTVTLAAGTGLAGCSIEDYGGDEAGLYDIGLAAERVSAAAEAARNAPVPLVLTARAENFLRGNPDLADTIARLQRYQEAGADVLYAPGLSLLAELGVARISVGSAFALVAIDALARAAREFREIGTLGFWERAAVGGKVAA